MLEQKTSTDNIKKWESPKIVQLDISETKLGRVNGSDGEGADEDDLPLLS